MTERSKPTPGEALAIKFQEAAAEAYAYCHQIVGVDRYIPRVQHHQNIAAQLAAEAMRHTAAAIARAQGGAS